MGAPKVKQSEYAGSCAKVADKPALRLNEFAFIGRSNVGKSSLINCLCERKDLAHTSATPGKTQCINHFKINNDWYLVDLPGYGYAKLSQKFRERIRNIIDEYVTNSEEMVLLFVLLDSRHDIQKVDLEFLLNLGENGIPFSIVFTKCDKMGTNALANQVEKNRQKLLEYWEELPPIFLTSAASGRGREELLEYIFHINGTLKNQI